MTYFDAEAETYDSWYETALGSYVDQAETEAVFDLLKPVPGEKIIDVGCGTGNFSIKLARTGCSVTGVDVSGMMLSKAGEKTAGLDVSLCNADSASLPFPDNSFDAAISVTAFEFMKEREKSFDEMMRVVKKGGRVVIGTINRNSSWGELYESLASQKKTVFQYAKLLDRQALEAINRKKIPEIREALYFSPDSDVSFSWQELEKRYEKANNGGFLCAVWKK